jgi:hypothetical protein
LPWFAAEETAHAVFSVHFAKDPPLGVGRAVVHDENLLLDGDRLHLAHDLADRLRLVVDGHHDG